MPMEKTFTSNFPQNNTYLERHRLNELLSYAVNFPLVAVYAGSGYGKTRAIHAFLEKQNAHTTWMQITERDNTVAHFWDKYVNMISLIWPESAARLQEIGFPDSEDAFAKYTAVRIDTLSAQEKCYFVYDDFHLLHNPVLLQTFERIQECIPPGGTVIVISRTIPKINLTSMMMRERIFIIREDTLCFTEDEIAEYFSQLGLSTSRQDIRDIYDDTRGWAFAVNLAGRSLSNDKKYERYALEAMKENIFKLIEAEIADRVSDRLWRLLLRISLIDHHAAGLIRILADDEGLIEEMEALNAYIRYDYHHGMFMIHHMLIDYLRRHVSVLTDEERRDTFNKAGKWCESNKYQSDALAYYEKAGDYDAIMRILYQDNIQMAQNYATLALGILERIPAETASQNQFFPAMHIKIVLSLGMFDESIALMEKYTAQWEARPESPEKNRALAEIYGIRAISKIIMSPFTDKYDFDVYFKKHSEYYDKGPYAAQDPTIRQSVGAYSLLIGADREGAPEEYIEAMSSAIQNTSPAYKDILFGLDDLSRGELCFYQRDINNAERYMQLALEKARTTNQYSIQNHALMFMMLIAFSRSDINAATGFVRQIEAHLEIKEYSARYDSYDIAISHYYLALGQPDKIRDWLKADFSPYTHPTFLANFANRVKASYCYQMRQYNTLLAFIENVQESNLLLVGKIIYKVLAALVLYQMKRKDESIAALTEAYTIASPNKIIVPFTQYAKDMRTLTAAALKEDACTIPKSWLEDINRKSSAFARRQTNMVSELKSAGASGDAPVLTIREIEMLKDLSGGMSRIDIAAKHNVSITTVKLVIHSIYDKLCVSSLHDALRIAITRKII